VDFGWSCYRRVSTDTLGRVVPNALAVAGTAAIAGWVIGVAGAFGPTANWTLFVGGLALLVVARFR
jgi:hypothetical protein